MKRVFGLILLGFGVALLVTAPLSRFYIAPALAVAPLDQYTISSGAGVVIKQLDLVKFASGDPDPYYPPNLPLTSTRYTRGDVLAAEQEPAKSSDLAIYNTFSRSNVEGGRLVSASTSRYAFDRKTSQLANCCGANENGATVTFSGLLPLKFPFFVKQQAYDVWDSTLLISFPSTFQGIEDHAGVSTYKFVQAIPPTVIPNSAQAVPARLVGLPGTGDVTVNRFYANSITLWVEPSTGQLVDSSQALLQTLRGPDNTTDLATVAQVESAGDPVYVSTAALKIKADVTKLNLLMTVIPIVGLVLGILCVILGIALLRASGRKEEGTPDEGHLLGSPGYLPPPPPMA